MTSCNNEHAKNRDHAIIDSSKRDLFIKEMKNDYPEIFSFIDKTKHISIEDSIKNKTVKRNIYLLYVDKTNDTCHVYCELSYFYEPYDISVVFSYENKLISIYSKSNGFCFDKPEAEFKIDSNMLEKYPSKNDVVHMPFNPYYIEYLIVDTKAIIIDKYLPKE